MPERVAVYPGSFDPPTNGHLDLIRRATRLFDNVIVGVAVNNAKSALFTPDERIELLAHATRGMKRVELSSFAGLTVDFARSRGAIALIRGLRVVSDFEYELTMAITNQKLAPDLDTVILMPGEDSLLVSSRLVKEIALFGGDISAFVPPGIGERVREKLHRTGN